MAKKKQGRFNIPEDPHAPSVLGTIIMFCIPGFGWAIGCYLVYKHIMSLTTRKRLQLFRRYASAIGDSATVSLRELSARMDVPTENLAHDLQAMIDEGYAPDGAYIDYSHMTLHLKPAAGASREPIVSVFVSPEDRARTVAAAKATQAERAASAAKRAAPVEKPAEAQTPRRKPPEPVRSSTDSENFEARLREIRELNEAIEDPEVSERIDRIGELTASIFRVVREKPEHAEEVRKFMNYYLPTTLKLLSSYSLMEKQSYQGENIQASRKKIEDVLETLVHAFEQQQDMLFQSEALDVETDISVLETMMASDGLTERGQGLHL